jgi:hypothetical protein
MNGRTIRVPLLLVVILARGQAGSAEEPVPPRVRLSVPGVSERPIIGRLVGADESMLRIETGGGRGSGPSAPSTMSVPRSAVTRLELSRRASRKTLGAWLGALVGGGAAAVLVAGREESIASLASCVPPPGWGLVGQGRPYYCSDASVSQSGPSNWTALLAVPAGAALGALVAPGEKWETRDPASVRVEVQPMAGRAPGLRLVVSF